MIDGAECWSGYYTPKELANALVGQLPHANYGSAIDICCGSFNLLEAASDIFPGIKLTGVDINEVASVPDEATFYNMDGRLFADICEETFDLILSNPPFGASDDDHTYNRGSRIEYDMLASNISLMHEGSILLAIMPSTFVEGIKYRKLRTQISEQLCLLDIISLPDNSFHGGIRTYCIIASLGATGDGLTRLSSMVEIDGCMTILDSKYINASLIRSGDWVCKSPHYKSSVSILRGRLKSSDLRPDYG